MQAHYLTNHPNKIALITETQVHPMALDSDSPPPLMSVKSPIEPIALHADSRVAFDCHPGVPCFNACCRNIDITLTPYDIVRLKRRLNMKSRVFVAEYTIPFEMDHHSMPGLKLATKPGTAECVFLKESGCSVYSDRPTTCRYYALGNMGVKPKNETAVKEVYFIIKETHCKGHEQPRTRTVREYRKDQGIEEYDNANHQWRDLILKKRSSGPTVGRPSQRSMQLFDMCSYDLDSMREFIQSPGFRQLFALDDEHIQLLVNDEDELLQFSMRFLQQTLFGEQTIPLREGGRERRIEARKKAWTERRQADIQRHREQSEPQ